MAKREYGQGPLGRSNFSKLDRGGPRRQRDPWQDAIELYGTGEDPDEPTTAVPGTMEKIEIMASRARLGKNLFHPLDRVAHDGITAEELARLLAEDGL